MRRLTSAFALALPLVLLSLATPSLAQKAEKPEPASSQKKKGDGKISVTWLGHAAFEVVSPAGTRLLIDPFLKANPATPAAYKDLTRYQPDVILVSHSHQDHKGDASEIARTTGAKVVGAFDMVSGMKVPDAQKLGGNVGGSVKVKDATITFVPAMHASDPGGRPVGFIIQFDGGRTLYHTGDTWIFNDMSFIQELYKPEIILLNTGGGPFTQTPDVAKLAVKKFFKPKTIIPMHYGTFPPLAKEDDVKKAFGKDKRLKVLKPGETVEL